MTHYQALAAARQPVIVDAVRTPFLRSAGAFGNFQHHELAALPIRALLERNGVAPDHIQYLTMGAVVQELSTPNLAREAALAAGLPASVPGYSVSVGGLAPMIGLTHICDMIALGRLDVGIAAGSELFSDIPMRMPQPFRRLAARYGLANSAREQIKAVAELRPKDLIPEIPSPTDLTTGKTMGENCEAMVQRFGVSREDSDAFTARSHALATAAWAEGRYADDVIAVEVAAGQTIERDDGMRADSGIDKLAKLKPAFGKQGIITAGSASGITDGAVAQLLMSAESAAAHGLKPLGRVVDFQIGAVNDLNTEMLMGPAITIPPLLARNGLDMQDIQIFELHEAFAAQVLCNQKALADDAFCRKELGLAKAPGPIPEARLNCWGGSLALGNPFAGTSGRTLSTALRRLQSGGGRFAIVSTCAGGGYGGAILLENTNA